MVTQLSLPLRAPSQEDIAIRLADLRATLCGRGWTTSRQLAELGYNDRELRSLVEADTTGDILSFPGSPGYRLFAEATIEEIHRSQSLRSQGRAMLSRYLRYQRRLHRGPAIPSLS